jgi:hypothetical protein
MNAGVRTTLSAVAELDTALVRFEQSVLYAQQQATLRCSAAGGHIAAAHDLRRAEHQRAVEALRSATDERAATAARAACERTQDRLARAERAVRLANQADTALHMALSRFSREANDAIRDGRTLLSAARRDLETYLGAGGGGAASSATPLAIPPSFSAPVAISSVKHVELSAIDTSDREISAADFQKGYSPDDLKWAYHALHEVVMPGVAAGRGRDYFTRRDAAEGRQGTRSYSDTFGGFFGDDAIRLERRGDKYVVTNGYHRIWIAKQMGLQSVPARVVE